MPCVGNGNRRDFESLNLRSSRSEAASSIMGITQPYEYIVVFAALAAVVLSGVTVVVLVINYLLLKSALRELFSISIVLKSFAQGIAASLASGTRMEQTAIDVAKDLSDSHARADAVVSGNHGAAADAASQQTAKEKRIEKQLT